MRSWLAAIALGVAVISGVSGAAASSPSVADFAQASEDAYAFTREAAWHAPRGTVVVHEARRSRANGFQAIALLREADGALFVSYTGTKLNERDTLDFAANRAAIRLATHPDAERMYRQAAVDVDARHGNVDPQSERYMFELVAAKVREAKLFFDEAVTRARAKRPGLAMDRVYVTGHSLGGFLAEIVGAANNVVTHTFDPAPGANVVLGTTRGANVQNHERAVDGGAAPARRAHVGKLCIYPAGARVGAEAQPDMTMATFAKDLAKGLRATSCD